MGITGDVGVRDRGREVVGREASVTSGREGKILGYNRECWGKEAEAEKWLVEK